MFGPIGMNGSGIRTHSTGSIARGRPCPPAVPAAPHRWHGRRIDGATAGAAMRALPPIASSNRLPAVDRACGADPRRAGDPR